MRWALRCPARAEGTRRQLTRRTHKRMRILLQQKGTGLYLTGVDAWSPHSSEAMDFVSSTAALDFCAANKLADVQLVLKFEEEQHDIVLPVVAAGQHRAEPPRPSL